MENKEIKNSMTELDDEALESVGGGADSGTPRTDGKIEAGIKCKKCRAFFNFFMQDEIGATKIIQCPYCITSHTITFEGDRITSKLTY